MGGAVTHRADVYGWSEDLSLEAAAQRVAAALGVRFTARSSDYVGDYLYWWDRHRDIAIRSNVPDSEGYLTEPDHPEHRVIVYANFLQPEAFEALAAVPGLVLLDTDLIDDIGVSGDDAG